MATISRFIKFTVPNLARHKFLIYDLLFHCRVFEPFDRKLCSKASEDYDNDVLANADHELFGRKPKSAQLNSDYNFSSEIPSKKSDEILPFIRFKEHEHYRNFSSYIFAKKLGEVESAEDFVPHKKIYSTIKDINVLLNVPVACKHFNNGQFPNEKSMLNWIRAIDFGLEQRCITPFGLSIALFSFARLLKDHLDNDKLLSVVGCDRLTTWFQFALKDHNSPSVRNT
uniref:Uncharacterized protein n=1 Tax=Romanomermis culicivorax TaxID=13658 RepID=A0A915JN05_ROMCU